MARAERDEYSERQKTQILAANARDVAWKYPQFAGLNPPCYMCENCRFISNARSDFEIDHLVSCAQGGNASRDSEFVALAIAAESVPDDKRPYLLARAALLMLANENSQVLCRGCNQGKKSKGIRPDDIPPGCGYAYTKRSANLNPDGAPAVVGVQDRYRRKWESY